MDPERTPPITRRRSARLAGSATETGEAPGAPRAKKTRGRVLREGGSGVGSCSSGGSDSSCAADSDFSRQSSGVEGAAAAASSGVGGNETSAVSSGPHPPGQTNPRTPDTIRLGSPPNAMLARGGGACGALDTRGVLLSLSAEVGETPVVGSGSADVAASAAVASVAGGASASSTRVPPGRGVRKRLFQVRPSSVSDSEEGEEDGSDTQPAEDDVEDSEYVPPQSRRRTAPVSMLEYMRTSSMTGSGASGGAVPLSVRLGRSLAAAAAATATTTAAAATVTGATATTTQSVPPVTSLGRGSSAPSHVPGDFLSFLSRVSSSDVRPSTAADMYGMAAITEYTPHFSPSSVGVDSIEESMKRLRLGSSVQVTIHGKLVKPFSEGDSTVAILTHDGAVLDIPVPSEDPGPAAHRRTPPSMVEYPPRPCFRVVGKYSSVKVVSLPCMEYLLSFLATKKADCRLFFFTQHYKDTDETLEHFQGRVEDRKRSISACRAFARDSACFPTGDFLVRQLGTACQGERNTDGRIMHGPRPDGIVRLWDFNAGMVSSMSNLKLANVRSFYFSNLVCLSAWDVLWVIEP